MTDESDRMDRARRIRQMREGDRQTNGESGAGNRDAATESGTDADSPADGDDADSPAGGDDTDSSADGNEGDSTADDDADSPAGGDDADDPDGVDEAQSDADATPDDADARTDDAGNSRDAAGKLGDAPASTDESDSGGGDGGTLRIPGAELGDVDVDPAELAREAGLDAMGVDERASPADDAGAAVGPPGAPGTGADRGGTSGDETRVLEFDLGDERYCLDIDYVEEIVKRDTVTRVPNTPDFVEGVVDLRGQITTILDPKRLLDIDVEGPENLLVVFDPDGFEDQGAIGWIVDDVTQVTPVAEDEVNDSPVDQDHVEGIVDRDGEFVIWTTPELAFGETAG